jgi:hypothetical protein
MSSYNLLPKPVYLSQDDAIDDDSETANEYKPKTAHQTRHLPWVLSIMLQLILIILTVIVLTRIPVANSFLCSTRSQGVKITSTYGMDSRYASIAHEYDHLWEGMWNVQNSTFLEIQEGGEVGPVGISM